MTSVAHDLIGSGWAFPGRVSPSGTVALTDGVEKIESAMALILQTRPGERVMRPEFGCAAWEQLFGPLDASTLGLVEHATREALSRWEPRIDVEAVAAAPGAEESSIEVTIDYVVRATNDQRNLVHPFYVIPREGGAS